MCPAFAPLSYASLSDESFGRIGWSIQNLSPFVCAVPWYTCTPGPTVGTQVQTTIFEFERCDIVYFFPRSRNARWVKYPLYWKKLNLSSVSSSISSASCYMYSATGQQLGNSTRGTSHHQLRVVKCRCIQGSSRIARTDTVLHMPTPLNYICLSSAVLFSIQRLVLQLKLYVAEQPTLLASSRTCARSIL